MYCKKSLYRLEIKWVWNRFSTSSHSSPKLIFADFIMGTNKTLSCNSLCSRILWQWQENGKYSSNVPPSYLLSKCMLNHGSTHCQLSESFEKLLVVYIKLYHVIKRRLAGFLHFHRKHRNKRTIMKAGTFSELCTYYKTGTRLGNLYSFQCCCENPWITFCLTFISTFLMVGWTCECSI